METYPSEEDLQERQHLLVPSIPSRQYLMLVNDVDTSNENLDCHLRKMNATKCMTPPDGVPTFVLKKLGDA